MPGSSATLAATGRASERRRAAAAVMRAARLHAFGEVPRVDRVSVPSLRHGQVLVRVAGAGVCHSDVDLAGGLLPWLPLPAVLGHEVSGWVESAGPGADHLRPGTPVLVFGGWGCGTCRTCRRGDEQLCDVRRWAGVGAPGGFADFILVPGARHLVPLGDHDPVAAVPLADAALTPYRAVRRSIDRLVPGTAAVVLGAGPLGQMAVQIVKALTPVHVVSVDVDPRRRGGARESGADAFVARATHGDVVEALAGRPAAAVFDMVASRESVPLAAAVVAPQGRVVVAGLGPGRLDWSALDVAPEASITTSWWGNRSELGEVVALARSGRIFMRTERFPLEHVDRAMDAVREGMVDGRAVLVP